MDAADADCFHSSYMFWTFFLWCYGVILSVSTTFVTDSETENYWSMLTSNTLRRCQ